MREHDTDDPTARTAIQGEGERDDPAANPEPEPASYATAPGSAMVRMRLLIARAS